MNPVVLLHVAGSELMPELDAPDLSTTALLVSASKFSGSQLDSPVAAADDSSTFTS